MRDWMATLTIRFCISSGKTRKKTVNKIITRRSTCKPRQRSRTQENSVFFVTMDTQPSGQSDWALLRNPRRL